MSGWVEGKRALNEIGGEFRMRDCESSREMRV